MNFEYLADDYLTISYQFLIKVNKFNYNDECLNYITYRVFRSRLSS